MGAALQLVVERSENDPARRDALCTAHGDPDELISQPGVLGQARAVEVGREHVSGPGPLQAVTAVVARPRDHSTEGLAARPELRQAGVVLEAHDRLRYAVDRDLAGGVLHESLRAASRLQVEDAGSEHLLAGVRDVAVTQQLQPGAHGEDHHAVRHGVTERRRLAGEVLGSNRHLDVLPAVEQDDVERPEVRRLGFLDGHNLDRDAPPLRPALYGDEIAAVAGHVQQRRIQMGDAQWLVIARIGRSGRLDDRHGRSHRDRPRSARMDGRSQTDRSRPERSGGPRGRLADGSGRRGDRRESIGRIGLIVGRGGRDDHGRGRGLVRNGRPRGLALGHTAQYLPVQPRRRISSRSSISGVYPDSTMSRSPGGSSASPSSRAPDRLSTTLNLPAGTPA